MFLALAVLACVIPAQASAASNPSVPDVPASFWAHAQIMWSVKAGWVPLHKNGTFAPERDATRTAAARVLASLNQQQHGVAVSEIRSSRRSTAAGSAPDSAPGRPSRSCSSTAASCA